MYRTHFSYARPLAFLGTGFTLTNVYSPDITFQEDMGVTSNTCGGFTSCGGCTSDPGCGFCYGIDGQGEAANGSCVDIPNRCRGSNKFDFFFLFPIYWYVIGD